MLWDVEDPCKSLCKDAHSRSLSVCAALAWTGSQACIPNRLPLEQGYEKWLFCSDIRLGMPYPLLAKKRNPKEGFGDSGKVAQSNPESRFSVERHTGNPLLVLLLSYFPRNLQDLLLRETYYNYTQRMTESILKPFRFGYSSTEATQHNSQKNSVR